MLRLPPDGVHADALEAPEVLTVARSGRIERARLAQTAQIQGRVVTFAWVEQEPPTLGASMAPVINPIISGG